MSFSNVIIQKLDYSDVAEKKLVVKFLKDIGLELEKDVEQTIVVKDAYTKKIVGTGSISANVLKCIGVDPEKRVSIFHLLKPSYLPLYPFRRKQQTY